MSIEIHSQTWETLKEALREERKKAVNSLIADRDSDKQRGKIELIDKILKLPDTPDNAPIKQDTYV